MKKFVAWLLVLALTAAVSIGATLAYLTDTDEDVNVMTLGKVKIDQLEYERVDTETKDAAAVVQKFHDNKPLFPAVTDKDNFDWETNEGTVDWEQIGKDGYTSTIWDPARINNEVDKMVFVKNKGDYDAFVRSIFAFEAGNYETLDEYLKNVHLNLNDTDWNWEWAETPVTIGESTYFVATATYNDILEPGALTEISLSQIALDKTATNADVEAFGDTYQILVKSQAIQADGFDSAAKALDEGFGLITAANIPWENDSPVAGAAMGDALHYLYGDTTMPPITQKITNITYGLIKDYPEIVNAHESTLVGVEQQVPVYVYYVENGDYYDLYFLANGPIYAPADSTQLFYNMAELQTVNTSNLDVSRVVTMEAMFRGCKKLVELDTSHWDTGNVKSLKETFYDVELLTELDVSNWDVSNVETMESLFYRVRLVEELDVSEWDTSSVTNMHQTFRTCVTLSHLDVSDWDVSNVTDMSGMFKQTRGMTEIEGIGNWNTKSLVYCNSMFSSNSSNSGDMNYTKLDIENWDVSNVVHMGWMFYGCGQLTELDLSKWDVSNVKNMYHMFADCFKLESINFSGWNTAKIDTMDGMFNDCRALKVIDVSDFDTATLTDAAQLFEYCNNLEQIIGLDKWDVRNVLYMDEMFQGDKMLKSVDFTGWETSSLTSTRNMFHECYELESVTFGDKWDMSKVTDMGRMFRTAKALKSVDMSMFNTSAVVNTEQMFENCSALETIYVGDGWDMSKVTSSGSMFSNCSELVGGNGTVYNSSKRDASYARVDTPETPGYLTYKAPANP